MTITKALLDKAIATGTPLTVRERAGGDAFAFTVASYDRRMVRGSYDYQGTRYDGTFHRADLESAQ